MASHMKTTIHVADALLLRGKAVAAREGTTLRALVEEGLRLALARRERQQAFELRDGAVQGEGLQREQSWALRRELAYDEVEP